MNARVDLRQGELAEDLGFAFEEGHEAHLRQECFESNPYDQWQQPGHFRAWLEGWDMASVTGLHSCVDAWLAYKPHLEMLS